MSEDTGCIEADRIIDRLTSSDPDFDDCVDACVLIRKLVAEHTGPDGFGTWRDAAIAERVEGARLRAGLVELKYTLEKDQRFYAAQPNRMLIRIRELLEGEE